MQLEKLVFKYYVNCKNKFFICRTSTSLHKYSSIWFLSYPRRIRTECWILGASLISGVIAPSCLCSPRWAITLQYGYLDIFIVCQCGCQEDNVY
ncbi:UNVERIFIED_CONTAM: hypothetical protein NCL1_26566 [Trichonephila clavipes]